MPRNEGKITRINTSINIKPNLWKEAKIEAIKEDLTVSELVEEAIMEYIRKKAKEEK